MAKDFLSSLFGRRDERGGAEPERGPAPSREPRPDFLARLSQGLSKSSARISDGVAAIFAKKKLDAATLEALEELLISADLGVPAASRITASLGEGRFEREVSESEVRGALADAIARELAPCEAPLVIDRAKAPFVILMTGVNGSGKTTTIGKLAARFRQDGLSVMLGAGDTFRAAAIEQLSAWGERAGAAVIARPVGSDASGLAFEALEKARADGRDVLILDTAGRLQNRRELMDELAKIVRVLKKIDESAPHATLLVLDATVGQNAFSQVEAFQEIAGVTGIVMTKLDGTARGGVLVALAEKFKMPVHLIGVGEGIEDLQPFRAADFARALVGERP